MMNKGKINQRETTEWRNNAQIVLIIIDTAEKIHITYTVFKHKYNKLHNTKA